MASPPKQKSHLGLKTKQFFGIGKDRYKGGGPVSSRAPTAPRLRLVTRWWTRVHLTSSFRAINHLPIFAGQIADAAYDVLASSVTSVPSKITAGSLTHVEHVNRISFQVLFRSASSFFLLL